MKRSRNKPALRMSRDAEQLVGLASAMAASGNALENHYWQNQLASVIVRLLDAGNDAAVTVALDKLFEVNLAAHDALLGQAESLAESQTIRGQKGDWDVLMVALPMVVRSHYPIPNGPIGQEALDVIATHLRAHILARDARLIIIPFCYSVDHMPMNFSALRKLTNQLGRAAIDFARPSFAIANPPAPIPLLADTRFVLATVAVPSGGPLFRWQEEHCTRLSCLEPWSKQGQPHLARLLPGCSVECLLPDAYFASCKEADKRIRPYAIYTAMAYLERVLKAGASDLCAVIAGVGSERIDEYRISFLRRHHPQVVHGVVWPLYETENDDVSPTVREQVEDVLRQCKVGEVVTLAGLFAPESCDDCDAPLFPDCNGEMLHPEPPESAPLHTAPFH